MWFRVCAHHRTPQWNPKSHPLPSLVLSSLLHSPYRLSISSISWLPMHIVLARHLHAGNRSVTLETRSSSSRHCEGSTVTTRRQSTFPSRLSLDSQTQTSSVHELLVPSNYECHVGNQSPLDAVLASVATFGLSHERSSPHDLVLIKKLSVLVAFMAAGTANMLPPNINRSKPLNCWIPQLVVGFDTRAN